MLHHYERYNANENPFIRMHAQDLRLQQKEKVDYMKGPKKLRKELETASHETTCIESEGLYAHKEFMPQEVSRYDYLQSLLSEFDEVPEYANDRSARNCIDYVAFEVIIEMLVVLNKQIGNSRTNSNADAIIGNLKAILLDDELAEDKVSPVLQRTVEENDVQEIDEHAIADVILKIREIIEMELTEQI